MNIPLEQNDEKRAMVINVAEMYANGNYTIRELAKKLGISKSSVGNYIGDFLLRVVGPDSDLYRRVSIKANEHINVPKRKRGVNNGNRHE